MTIETGSSTAKTASVESTISESSMSSANVEVSEPGVVQNAPTAKARKIRNAVQLEEELPTKPSKKRKAEAETSSSDTLELPSSSTAAEEHSSAPSIKKQKLTDLSTAVIATAEVPVLSVSASANVLNASVPTITTPPSPKKRNKRYDVPPRELPPREGRGKNSGLNSDMVGSLENIEPSGRKRKAAAMKEEMIDEPAAKKPKLKAGTAEAEATLAPTRTSVEVECKNSRAASVARAMPKEATKKTAKQSAAVPPKPTTEETSSADMLDAALRIVATEKDATLVKEAVASKKTTNKSTALSSEPAAVKSTTKKAPTPTEPVVAKITAKKDPTPALPAPTKKSTRKQAILPAAPPSPVKKAMKRQSRREGAIVGVDTVIKGKVTKIRQRAPPKAKQTPVNVVESESEGDEMEG
ncbi:hypothetical protein LTR95_008793 [Oleoguttula sp. CCFEE 5521]